MEIDTGAQIAACAWLANLKSTTEKEPFAQLFGRLRRQTIVSVVNQANTFAKQVSNQWQTAVATDELAGADIPHCQSCCICLYYWILHGLTQTASKEGLKTPLTQEDALSANCSIADNQGLQLSLLNCAAEMVTFAHFPALRFPALSVKLDRRGHILELWQTIGIFWKQISKSKPASATADSLLDFLAFMRMRITEQLAWRNGSDLYVLIQEHDESDRAVLLGNFLVAASRLAASRVNAAVQALSEVGRDIQDVSQLEQESLFVLDKLLLTHLDIAFNQHLSNLVSCCIYGAARKLNIILSFKRINGCLLQCFPHQTLGTFQKAEITPSSSGQPAILGETRDLYNNVFLPRMQDVLQQSNMQHSEKGSIGRSALPLRSLSATDMNVRNGSARRMASMQRK